jgi:hypothetical protein
MKVGVALVALATAICGASVYAQPDKDLPKPKAPASRPAPVVLASASDVRGSSVTAADRSEESARRPAPRVTICRCGDAQSAEEQPDQ